MTANRSATARNLGELFDAEYPTARAEFLTLARQAGWAIASHELAARGPTGEPLHIDEAIWEPADPTATLIVTSGQHGAEGPVGSAIQRAWLQQWQSPAETRTRVVLVHALNPFGFAAMSRVNEDNVDLNRNFLPRLEDYRGSPADYARFHTLLNPQSPPVNWEAFRLRGTWLILRHGLQRLHQAIAAGQYDYPQGLFFGGRGPCESTNVIRASLERWVRDTSKVLHLDIHSGLGAFGELQLLLDLPIASSRRQELESVLQQPLVTANESSSVGYAATGSIGVDLTRQLSGRDYDYVCVEFGTHGPFQVLRALRADCRLQYWTPEDRRLRPDTVAAVTRRTKAQVREAFCPRSAAWREGVLTTGVRLLNSACGHDPAAAR